MSKTASIDTASETYRRRRHNIVANVVKIVTQEHSRKALFEGLSPSSSFYDRRRDVFTPQKGRKRRRRFSLPFSFLHRVSVVWRREEPSSRRPF